MSGIGTVPSDRTESFDIGGFAAAVRRALPALALWMIACLALAGLYILRAPVEYTASTQIAFSPTPQKKSANERDTATIALDAAQAESRIQAVKAERLLRFVFETRNLQSLPDYQPSPPGLLRRLIRSIDGSPEPSPAEKETASFLKFMDKVDARRVGLSYVMEVSFRARTADMAASLVTSITAAYIRDRVLASDRDEEILARRISDIQRQSEILTNCVLNGTSPSGEFPEADARIIGAAITPLSKSSPKTGLILAFSTVFAVLSGLGMVFLNYSSDRRIRTAHRLREATGLPCVASLALSPNRGRNRKVFDVICNAVTGSASRNVVLGSLVAQLSMTRSREGHPSIAVASCARGAGTSSICFSLASLLARSGQPVVLVDANGCNPSLSQFLAAGRKDGLADVLSHQDVDGCHLNLESTTAGFRFLPSGRGVGDGGEIVVGPHKLGAIVRRLRAESVVIIDLPPLDPAGATMLVGADLTGLFLVVEAGATHVDAVTEALTVYRQVAVEPIGAVLNKVPERRRWIFSRMIKAARSRMKTVHPRAVPG